MLLVGLLLGVEVFDELYSGVPSVGAAEVQSAFGVSYETTTWVLLIVPGLVSFCVEPFLFVLADRFARKPFVCGGLLAMATAAFAAAAASSAWVVSAALSLAFIGSGCAVTLSQATLVDARPEARERVLTRWVFFGEIGDLLAPLLLSALAAAAYGWRSAYVCMGVLALLWAVLLWGRPFPVPNAKADVEADSEPGFFSALSSALANRRLLFWLAATALCDLLDEIVVIFAALYLRDHLAAGPAARSFILAAGVLGAIVGAAAAERLLGRIRPLVLLLLASVSCAGFYLAWLGAGEVWTSTLGFFAVGLTAAPMYPIASAQAYAALPGRSGTVNAAGHVFTPLSLALPWLIAVVADVATIRAALLIVLLQPLGLAAAAAYALSRDVQPPER